MYNKKMIAMMLALSMLAASLAGCAGDDDDDVDVVEINGCMDSAANNYDATATTNDTSCTYDPVVVTHKIGLLNPMTGELGTYSGPFTFAANEAIKDLNAMDANVQFELLELDTQSTGEGGAAAATQMVSSGVVGVAGAASSTVTMAANAVLEDAGIVQVSYASTSPALSDPVAYPHFWRVVSTDLVQGPAMKAMVSAAGHTSPALVHMNNDYGTGLADAFEAAWGADNLCTKVSYAQDSTDFQSTVSSVSSATGCDSVVMVSYASDGADIMETMAVAGVSLPVFGADGVADAGFLAEFSVPGLTNGMQATKPGGVIVSAGDFTTRCAASDACSGGIYTAETYDAVMMIGKAAAMEGGQNMPTHLNMVGTNYAGASGVHSFDANGDVGGSGYDVCQFDALSSSDVYFSCRSYWTSASDAITAHPFTGMTLKIGFMIPETGELSQYAPGFVAAKEIAMQALNTAGYGFGVQFEAVTVDTGSGEGTTSADSAATLVSAGVIAVVGAAGSTASMSANAVLSDAGIPMISYASTSPTLSDSTTYPHFYRVVPSDAIQGPALSDVVANRGSTSPALIYLNNDYGSDFASSFRDAWGADNLCQDISYSAASTNLMAEAQQIADDTTCDSVVMISYPASGAQLLEDLNTAGFTGAIYGGDGIAETGLCAGLADITLCDGIVATKPADGTASDRSNAFAGLCAAVDACANGIYTSATFDAFILIGFAVVAGQDAPGTPMSDLIRLTGQGFVGASGTHTFNADGDVGGNGYCIGDFTVADGVADYTCTGHWDLNSGVTNLTTS